MAERWAVHTVVFDLDDTLYPERDYVYSGFKAVGDHLLREHGVFGFEAAARTHFEAGHRGHIFDEVLPLLGVRPSAELIASLVAVYREHRPALSLFPDAAAALAWCRDRFHLGLITDGYATTQQRKVEALDLVQSIPHCILTDTLGGCAWKPSVVAFERMMELCPGPAAGFVYVADNPEKDFQPGKKLGWRTVRVRRPMGEHGNLEAAVGNEADAELADLAGLVQLLGVP